MTTNQISSRKEAEEILHARCERCVGYLSELLAIHLAMDCPTRRPIPSEAESVLRLRKVFFHILALTSWGVDTEVIHVMAPDIRAAKEQLEPIVLGQSSDENDIVDHAMQRRTFSDRNAQLAPFSHPTPAILIFSRDVGGLGEGDAILILSNLNLLLAELVVDYCMGLGVVADALYPSKQSEILDVMNRSGEDFGSLSVKEFLPFVDGNE